MAIGVLMVPDVVCVLPSDACAHQVLFRTKGIQLCRSKPKANGQWAKVFSQRFKDILTKVAARLNGEIRVVWNVHNAMCGTDLRIQKLPHLIVSRQPYMANLITC
jgi:hypothetical protein